MPISHNHFSTERFNLMNNNTPYYFHLSSGSNTTTKKYETELQTLKENNARLVDALQESSANVESWKKELTACQEESDTLRKKVTHSHYPAGKLKRVYKLINPVGREAACFKSLPQGK